MGRREELCKGMRVRVTSREEVTDGRAVTQKGWQKLMKGANAGKRAKERVKSQHAATRRPTEQPRLTAIALQGITRRLIAYLRTAAKLTIIDSSTCSNEACVEEVAIGNHDNQIHDDAPNDHAGLQIKRVQRDGLAQHRGFRTAALQRTCMQNSSALINSVAPQLSQL